jgi:hypothetical protein
MFCIFYLFSDLFNKLENPIVLFSDCQYDVFNKMFLGILPRSMMQE